jgi:hypothetical protein
MRHSTFFWFFLPTAAAMLLFIAFPILSVGDAVDLCPAFSCLD